MRELVLIQGDVGDFQLAQYNKSGKNGRYPDRQSVEPAEFGPYDGPETYRYQRKRRAQKCHGCFTFFVERRKKFYDLFSFIHNANFIIKDLTMANGEIVIWHNPRCSKSREALKLLESEGLEPEIFRYLDERPTKEQIEEVLKMTGLRARDIMRTKEAIYKELGLKDVDDEQKLIEAMAEHPRLIERPIVIKEGKAVLGRPPEKVLELVKGR